MRALAVLVLALGCQGTSGGILPDAHEWDAFVDPCAMPSDWATRGVRLIAPYERAPGVVAVDEAYAYWTESLTCADASCQPGAIVLRAPLLGGDREVLFESEMDQPGELAVTGDYLFVRIGDQLWRSQKDGTTPVVVGSQYGFIADADALYYWQGGTLIRLAADTLEEMPVGTAQEGGIDLQLAVDSAWWLDPDPVDIWQMRLTSGVAELVTQLGSSAGSELVIDRFARAFLAINDATDPLSARSLVRIAPLGAEPEPIAELVSGIDAIAVDDLYVYWIEPNLQRLSRAPVEGGCVETRDLATGSVALVPATDGVVVVTDGIALVER